MRRHLPQIALAAWLIALAALTLGPGRAVGRLPWWSLGGGTLAGVDAIANFALFAPAGWLLARMDWHWRRMLPAVLVLSTGIELAQLLIPGRTAILGDVLLNAIGALAGWGAHRAPGSRSQRAAWVWVTLTVLLVVHALGHSWSPREWGARTHFFAASDPAATAGDATVVPCAGPVPTNTVCLELKPTAAANEGQLVREPFATDGDAVSLADLGWDPACYTVRYHTLVHALRLREPRARVCPDRGEGMQLILHPTLRFHRGNLDRDEDPWYWTRVPASHFLFAFWPLPLRTQWWLPFAGAALFLSLLGLATGKVRGRDAVAYLLALSAAAGLGGLAPPGWLDVAAVVIGLLLARLLAWAFPKVS